MRRSHSVAGIVLVCSRKLEPAAAAMHNSIPRGRIRASFVWLAVAVFVAVLQRSSIMQAAERSIHPGFKPLSVSQRGPYTQSKDGRILVASGNAVLASDDLGKTWSEVGPIVTDKDGKPAQAGPGVPSGYEQILCTRSGTLVVVWMERKNLKWDGKTKDVLPGSTGGMWAIRSTDGGKTWTDKQKVYPNICGHPAINLLQTKSGHIVATGQPMLSDPGRNCSCTFVSGDEGKTWRRSNIIDLGGIGHHDGAFEPTIIELADGRLWMLLRTNWDRFWEAFSDDHGASWKTIRPSAIEASTSPGFLRRLSDGRIVLLWNRLYPEGESSFERRSGQFSEAEASWHRGELSMAFSSDEGKTWSKPLVIAREKGAWLAYPYLFEPKPGLLWIFSLQGKVYLEANLADFPPMKQPEARTNKIRAYFGGYTNGPSEGIYVADYDKLTGEVSNLRLAAKTPNPSFLAIHPSKKYLYAVSEIGDFDGKKTGAVGAFEISEPDGKLKPINRKSSGGVGPCYVSLDAEGKYAFAANYGGGSVACLPILADGCLGDPRSVVQHEGSSVNQRRQKEAHAHSINLDPTGKFALVCDLGMDKTMLYRFADGKLTPNDPPFAKATPGSGPRHLAFHPEKSLVYIINELSCTIEVFTFDSKTGAMDRLQTISTIPEGAGDPSVTTAEVQVHPSGKFVYGSNRGLNTLAVFATDDAGKLRFVEHEPTLGIRPRNFRIAPDGKFLIVANRESSNVVVFRIDQETGALEPTGCELEVPDPSCVRFFE